jgi:hypothetical protein
VRYGTPGVVRMSPGGPALQENLGIAAVEGHLIDCAVDLDENPLRGQNAPTRNGAVLVEKHPALVTVARNTKSGENPGIAALEPGLVTAA